MQFIMPTQSVNQSQFVAELVQQKPESHQFTKNYRIIFKTVTRDIQSVSVSYCIGMFAVVNELVLFTAYNGQLDSMS